MTHRHATRARARFVEDTASHQLQIRLDQGIYRHLQCRKPGDSCYHFSIVTWPGYLAVSGDMGEYIFCRLHDMFSFFRSPKGEINIPYWAEKCEAADTNGRGIQEYDVDTARELVNRRLRDRYEGKRARYRDALKIAREEVNFDDGQVRFYDSLMALQLPGCAGPDIFDSEDMEGTEEYTFHFIWVLHGIVWAINQYDAQKAVAAAIEEAPVL